MATDINIFQRPFEAILNRFKSGWNRQDTTKPNTGVAHRDAKSTNKGRNVTKGMYNQHPSSPHQQEQLKITQYPLCMALLFILTVEAILVAITESFIIFYHSSVFAQCEFSLSTLGLAQADLIYHGIIIISPIYQLFLYLDALRQRNIFQLFTVLLFGILLVICSGVQTVQHLIFEKAGCNLSFQNGNTTTFPNSTIEEASSLLSNKLKMSVIINGTTHGSKFEDNIDATMSNIRPFEYSTLAVIAICFVIMLIGAIKLYKLFKWKSYPSHIFPADIRLRNAIISWSIFSGLLKISFFYTFVYAMQLVPAILIGYTHIPAFECIIVFAVGLIAFLLAIYSVRNEEVKTLVLFDLIIIGSIGYFGYRLFTFGLPRDIASDPFLLTRYNLLFTALALTLLVILMLCTSLVCLKNILVNNIKILENNECICPTCHIYANNHTDTSSATLSTTTSFSSALSNSNMTKESLEIVPIQPKPH